MSTYLLTWNPERWNWESLDDDVRAVSDGRRTEYRWSTGVTKAVRTGDRLFMLKQGPSPRGLLASGWATSDWYQDDHWDDARAAEGVLANYVNVDFDVLLDPSSEDLLSGPVLRLGSLSQVHWSPQGSGISIPGEAAEELETVWARHIRAVRGAAAGRESDEAEFAEVVGAVDGQLAVRLAWHRKRERALREAKIEATLKKHQGVLECEAPRCGFDFFTVYGELGRRFAEVHHLVPLADITTPRRTTLAELAIVCSNCHAMIHRGGASRPLESLIPHRGRRATGARRR